MSIFLWVVGHYLMLGALSSFYLYQTKWRDNGWIIFTLFWPLYLHALITGE